MPSDPHFDLAPSPWVVRWAPMIRPGGRVLDVACGGGRHARWLARLGFEVEAVDRDPALFHRPPAGVRLRGADLEIGPWPCEGQRFDGIVVAPIILSVNVVFEFLARDDAPFVMHQITDEAEFKRRQVSGTATHGCLHLSSVEPQRTSRQLRARDAVRAPQQSP